jgi:hypothetical protein
VDKKVEMVVIFVENINGLFGRERIEAVLLVLT